MTALYNRVVFSTATAGTGTITAGAAAVGFFTMAEMGIADGTVVSFFIEDGSDVEINTGTVGGSSTTLTRDTPSASKIGGVAGTTKLTLSGSAVVYITALAADILNPAVHDAGTNNVPITGYFEHQTSNTPANGIGVGVGFKVETAAGNTETGALIEAVATDTSAASEDFDVNFYTMKGGATATLDMTLRGSANDVVVWRPLFVYHSTTGATALNVQNPDTGTGEAQLNVVSGTAATLLVRAVHQFGATLVHTTVGGMAFISNETILFGPNYDGLSSTYTGIMDLSGQFGWGTQSPDRHVHIEKDSAATNTVTQLLRLTSTSQGTPANGIGAGVEFEVETTSANNEIGIITEAYVKDVTSTSEDFGWRVKTMTAGQAAATSLDISLPGTAYPQGHLFGLTMSNAADTANDITVAAGEAVDETGVWNLVLPSAITKRIDGSNWVVGDNQDGLNTGTEAAGWYEVILIGREDTRVVDVMFSTTANRATLPANYTHKRRIGWVKRNPGNTSFEQFTQIDDYFTWTTQFNDVAATSTATAAPVTLTVPPSSIARFRATNQCTTSTNTTFHTVFSEIVEGTVTPAGTTGIASLGGLDLAATMAGHFELRVSSTSTIEHDSDGATTTFDISTYGFIDHRRKWSAT